MSLASAAVPCALLLALFAPGQGGAQKEKPPAPAASLGASNIDRISKLVRLYYAELDAAHPDPKKVKKALEKVLDETGKAAKSQKLADPLLAIDDWRDILRLAFKLEKPAVPDTAAGRGELKKVTIDSPLDPKADAKELGAVFDRKLKALISVPPDFAKVPYPVILALHPTESEVGKGLSSMKKGKEIEDAATAWATATYPKDVLAKAIVLVPILDAVKRGEDGISFSRPAWDSRDGVDWAMKALQEVVLKTLNFDFRRIFIDGSGSGAAAAVDFCANYPGLQTGAIVRGPLPLDPDFESRFENAAGTPILFVGGDKKEDKLVPYAKPLLDKYASVEGFSSFLVQKDALDDATLLGWVNDHPKVFAPKRIKLKATEAAYAESYWLVVKEYDTNLEKDPIFIEAVADREKNEITVVTNKKVKAFEVFFNDDVLDLSKELRILHRRTDDQAEPKELFKGLLKRVTQDALDNYYFRPYCNTSEVYVASKALETG
jgi:poly(3-hydroxybutyrate) depolymerase